MFRLAGGLCGGCRLEAESARGGCMAKGKKFRSDKEAKAELRMWQEILPKVESAYQPDGKLPFRAQIWVLGATSKDEIAALAGLRE